MSLFDPEDQRQLFLIDTRLNHNILVGKAVETLDRNPSMFANGETVVSALLAWVHVSSGRTNQLLGGRIREPLYWFAIREEHYHAIGTGF